MNQHLLADSPADAGSADHSASLQERMRLRAEMIQSGAVFRVQRLERIYRDLLVACQHIIVQPTSYDRVGQCYMTRDLPGGGTVDLDRRYIRGPHETRPDRSE